jgi:hypothetical protein
MCPGPHGDHLPNPVEFAVADEQAALVIAACIVEPPTFRFSDA